MKEFFVRRSLPAFLVGGCLRDWMHGLPSKDVDITVSEGSSVLAKELADALGGSFVPLGEAHGVARVVLPSTDSDKWTIDVSTFHGSIADDLARRDFTVDAMALPLEYWGSPEWQLYLIDPFGGRYDLATKVIRAVGPLVFREDPLRLLRAVRLAAKLGFQIDPQTRELISTEASLISTVASERVRDELLTLFSLSNTKTYLQTLDSLGLLCRIIPELAATKGVEQPKEHYWDVFGHSLHTVEAVEVVTRVKEQGSRNEAGEKTTRCSFPVPCSFLDIVPWSQEIEEHFATEASEGYNRLTLLKLGALLHDIAKPQTKTVDNTGRTRFLGHHTLGASMSQAILHRLRLSAKGIRMVCGMVEHHLRPTQMSQGVELPTRRAAYRYFRDVGEVAIDTLYLSLADYLAARGPNLSVDEWQERVRTISGILHMGTREKVPEKKPRLVTGHDLMAELGLTPGPLLGRLLQDVEEAQATEEVKTREEAVAWVRRRLKED